MSSGDQKPEEKSSMDDAVSAALKSVEDLQGSKPDEDFDLDSVQVLQAGDVPPSADPDARSEAPVMDTTHADEEDEVIAFDEDDAPAPKKASAQDAMLQAMIDAKNEAVGALAQTQKEATSFRERLVRVSAEFDNYKKRQVREKDDAIKFANEKLLKELLPVLDSFDRAMHGLDADEGDEKIKALVDGVDMVRRQFHDAMKRSGVEGFTSLGEPFDPAHHEAVSARDDTSVPNNTVVEEYQRGYKLNGRLVRPSMVIVSTGGPSGQAAAASEDTSVDVSDDTSTANEEDA